MSSVQPYENNNCCVSGQTNSAEDWAQKAALKEMMLEMIHHELEPIIENTCRKVVKEELRNLLIGLDRNPVTQVRTSELRHLRLLFLTNVSLPVLTGEEIKGEGQTSIEVALVDHLNEKVVDSGPEASAKVEIVVLKGDFVVADTDNWTSEEFNKKIVKEREGIFTKSKKKRDGEEIKPLLTGNVLLHLNKGIGFVNNIKFRQYAKWMKNDEFKLGARVIDTFSGIRIKEAVTESFTVKDRRCTRDRKGRPPSLSDDISKLKNIRKGGTLYKRLQEKKVVSVKDFLTHLFKDPEGLKHILGLESNLWEATVNHARKCMPDKRMSYYPSSHQNFGVVFNVVEHVLGVISRCQYFPIDKLSDKEKVDARKLAIAAFEHWKDVVHFDDKNSLVQYFSCLSTSEASLNSPTLDSPSGHDIEVPELGVEYNKIQLDAPSQGKFSSADSPRHRNNAEHVDSFSVNDVEVIEELLLNPSAHDHHPPSSSNTNSIMEFFENLWRQDKAKKSWKKLSIVLRISMKKVAPLGVIHVQKKQRID